MNWRHLVLLLLLAIANPASAQTTQASDERELSSAQGEQAGESPGSVADSVVGRSGQRQSKEEAAEIINPLGRIDSRIHNRVQNRIRNRIDQSYDPLANANAPFITAEEQQRKASKQGP